MAAGMVQSLLVELGAEAGGHRSAAAGQLRVRGGGRGCIPTRGVALSGLPVERWRRDLGREAVFHFLYCRQKPAPAMALAVCLSSPLMPWSREQGAVLAQTVMDGKYELKAPKGASKEMHAMLSLLREGDTEPATLGEALVRFAALLDGGDELAAHASQARIAVDELAGVLATARTIDWAGLRRAATPRLVTSGETPEFNLEGVTVWRESQEPWRPVRATDRARVLAGPLPRRSRQECRVLGRRCRPGSQTHRTARRDAGPGARSSSRTLPTASGGGRRGGDVSGAAS